LNKINKPDLNILTIEDPVEYELKGIGQVHVRPKIGLTFASGLRAFLRQDPDVIMVGEIRDQETAEIAIHASLTGHLVFSTLHTNDAAGAVARLVEMEIQPFLIASSLLAVLAQRLVRKLCAHCRQPFIPSDEDLRSLGLNPSHYGPPRGPMPASAAASAVDYPLGATGVTTPLLEGQLAPRPFFHRPVGCEACSNTGYSGRVGIYELLVVDEPIRRALLTSADSKTIAKVAVERGMVNLREDGARQVAAGRTSMEEVLAMTQAGEIE
jgi:general secretion pathway protein E